MNRITIIGNLTRDPESTTTQGGKSVCHFTVAVNRRQKNQDGQQQADFFRVSAWGQMGDACQKYLSKGRKVAVVGQVSLNVYKDQNGEAKGSLEVFAQDVEFLTPSNSGNSGGNGSGDSSQGAQADSSGFTPVETEELPF